MLVICEKSSDKSLLSDILLLPFENDTKVIGKWQLCGKLLDTNNLNALDKDDLKNLDEEIIFINYSI